MSRMKPPLTIPEQQRVRANFLLWSGGFKPEDMAQIKKYARVARDSRLGRKPVIQFLYGWMIWVPSYFEISKTTYDVVERIVKWYEMTPASIELSDHVWDDVLEQTCRPIEEGSELADFLDVSSVETEGEHLVAILCTNDSGREFDEFRVRVVKLEP